MGYEGLSVTIFLSSKKLVPYVEMTYEKKAPIATKIDDIVNKIQEHYQSIFADSSSVEAAESRELLVYTDKAVFTKDVLDVEASDKVQPFGQVFDTLQLWSGA
jgi:hypothetical protein